MLRMLQGLKIRFPRLFGGVAAFAGRHFARQLGRFPRPLARETAAVADVLYSGRWSMAYGKGLVHERLEDDFANYVGSPHAIAVNTGGMALQMSMRALGLKPGDEVALQVDTCSATAFSVLNAGCTPIFADISPRSFMLDTELLPSGTRAVIASHMWGNPEDMAAIARAARGAPVIEDACLALGTRVGGAMAGASGHTGVFSFGFLKPIQGGEGGMIVTADAALARELRSLRHWGDRSIEFGVRDTTQLAWNGRMSEIVAAVVREQLRGYPAHLRGLRDAAAELASFLSGIEGIELVLGAGARIEDCAFTQIVLRLDAARLGWSKPRLREALSARGIAVRDANFEPISSLRFFRAGTWRDWILAGDLSRAAANYAASFPASAAVFESTGLGIPNTYLLSPWRFRELKAALTAVLAGSKE